MLGFVKRKLFFIFKKKPYQYFPAGKSIEISKDLFIGDYRSINITDNNVHIKIAKNVAFRKFCNILVCPNGMLDIADNVFFNNYCSINCLGSIVIGENTLFGEGVKLYDHNHKYNYNNGILEVAREEFKIGQIKIGKNCWIGSNVTILNNVEIGDNVIIGANCLITKSVKANSIVKHLESLGIDVK